MIGAETMLVPRVAPPRTVIGLLLTAALCLSSAPPARAAPAAPVASETAAPPPAIDEEATRLGQALSQEVPHLIVDTLDSARAWIEYAQAAIARGGHKIDRPQLLVVVDRNPRVQQMRIVLARPDAPWQSLGGSKVSTGRPRGFEHFLTPTGVFPHTARILDWRAEGTFNENHVRGLGMAGMRVWDFGWQRAVKGGGPPGGVGKMRLLLHATDPATLERRIGSAASDGCVRLPTAMDRFLDVHGVLDSDYEQTARRNTRFAALLLPDRTPTALAGSALVIIDSSEDPALQGSTTPPAATPNPESAAAQSSRRAVGVNAKSRAERLGPLHRPHRVAASKHRRRA